MQRICSASRHCLAPSGNVWQEPGPAARDEARVAQALDGARLGAQSNGPAGIRAGPLAKAGDEI